MLPPQQATKGSSASRNWPSKHSTLVRCFFLLVVLGNIVTVTIYRSISIGNNTHESFSVGEAVSFSPPQPNSILSGEEANQSKTSEQNNQSEQGEQGEQTNLTDYERRRAEFQRARLSKPFNVTHFLSHIPKTGVEYAAQDLARLLVTTIPLPGDKDVLSISNAQKRYVDSLKNRPDYDENDPEWKFHHKNSRNHEHENPDSNAYSPPMICNNGATSKRFWSPFHFSKIKNIKFVCSMIVAEQPHKDQSPNVYTVVREPMSHVVSQYFHCSDSRNHKTSAKMPSMEKWLEAYVKLSNSLPMQSRPPYYQERWKFIKEAQELRDQFDCYNPIDSESYFVRFPAEDEDGNRLILPKDYFYPYPFDESLPRDEETKKLDQQLFDDLKNRFRIIGDTSRMIKTICSIFIDMTNGEHIPTPCNCTHWDEAKKKQHSSTPTFYLHNLYQPFTDRKQKSPVWILRPFVELGYHPEKHAHGVKIRGSEFVKTGLTASQKTEIAENLRPLDMILYNVSRAVFDVQTAELEEAHGVKICEDSFNREGEILMNESDAFAK